MVKKLIATVSVVFTSSLLAVSLSAQMSDDAVYSYVKSGLAAGKSQKDLAVELTRRGVTKEQAMRLKERYENEQGKTEAVQSVGAQERSRRVSDFAGQPVGEEIVIMSDDLETTVAEAPANAVALVYGRNIFANRNLTFAPSENMATPENYKLGPGDEVIIDIWGTNQTTIRRTISPEGYINIDDIGIVALSGMKVDEAERYMREKLNKIYSLSGDGAQSDMKLTLGNIRTIQVNVMGEVSVPGTYYLSSLSSVYHALYRAGGVSELGSLRNIQLIRKGVKIASVDIYDFLMKGTVTGDLTLQEGDIVLVQPYKVLAEVVGKVKRPMLYEMNEGETLLSLVEYAGGFSGDAYSENLNVVRRTGKEYQVFTVDKDGYGAFKIENGDVVTVGAMLERFENKIEIKGAVYRPGIFQLGNGVTKVSQLIAKADGLKGDAFTSRAILHRERENLTLEVIPLDVKAILEGAAEDIELKKNDALYIPSIHDLNDIGYITVKGEVARPGRFVYADNTMLEDIIIQAGGLLESASAVKVDVSRRVKNPDGIAATDTISKNFTFALKDGFVIDGQSGFHLEPYDIVTVRRSPGYSEQQVVRVYGEVSFAGDYVLTHKNQRLSELVAAAGGVTDWAYVKGARLSRRINQDERARMRATLSVLNRGRDSIDVTKLDFGDFYYVGIDLEQAIANPGSDMDVVLREGDMLMIPEYNNTVKITGSVMYPNTVVYNSSLNVKKFVEMAGGYGEKAKRSRSYVIYMNGLVAKAKKSDASIVQPGCEIVVPRRQDRPNALQSILAIATTSASLATMIATIGNIVKN